MALDTGGITASTEMAVERDGPVAQEVFTITNVSESRIAIKTAFGRYLSVDFEDGSVDGRAEAIGATQLFQPVFQGVSLSPRCLLACRLCVGLSYGSCGCMDLTCTLPTGLQSRIALRAGNKKFLRVRPEQGAVCDGMQADSGTMFQVQQPSWFEEVRHRADAGKHRFLAVLRNRRNAARQTTT